MNAETLCSVETHGRTPTHTAERHPNHRYNGPSALSQVQPTLPFPPMFRRGSVNEVYERHARAYAMNPNGYRQGGKNGVPGGPLLMFLAARMAGSGLHGLDRHMAIEAAWTAAATEDPEDRADRLKKRRRMIAARGWQWRV